MKNKFILFFTIAIILFSSFSPLVKAARTDNQIRKDIAVTDKRIKEIETEISETKKYIADVKEQITKLDARQKQIIKLVDRYNSDIEKNLQKINVINANLAKEENAAKKAELEQELKELNVLIMEIRAYLNDLKIELNNIPNKLDKLRAKESELEKKLVDLEKELTIKKNYSLKLLRELKANKTTEPKQEKPKEEEPEVVEEVKTGSVYTKYIQEDGNILEDRKAIKDNVPVGEEYSAEQKTFDGFEFVEMAKNSAPVEGKVVEGDTNVTFIYKKIEELVEEPIEEPKTKILKEGDPDDIDELNLLLDTIDEEQKRIEPELKNRQNEITDINNELKELEDNSDKCNLVKNVRVKLEDLKITHQKDVEDITNVIEKIESAERSIQYLKDGNLAEEEQIILVETKMVDIKNANDKLQNDAEANNDNVDAIENSIKEIEEVCSAEPIEDEESRKVKVGQEEEQKKSKSIFIYIIGGVLILGVIGAVGYFLYKNKKEDN